MTDFSKILDQAKELQNKMKESQEKIKQIEAIGISGANDVKITEILRNVMFPILVNSCFKS